MVGEYFEKSSKSNHFKKNPELHNDFLNVNQDAAGKRRSSSIVSNNDSDSQYYNNHLKVITPLKNKTKSSAKSSPASSVYYYGSESPGSFPLTTFTKETSTSSSSTSNQSSSDTNKPKQKLKLESNLDNHPPTVGILNTNFKFGTGSATTVPANRSSNQSDSENSGPKIKFVEPESKTESSVNSTEEGNNNNNLAVLSEPSENNNSLLIKQQQSSNAINIFVSSETSPSKTDRENTTILYFDIDTDEDDGYKEHVEQTKSNNKNNISAQNDNVNHGSDQSALSIPTLNDISTSASTVAEGATNFLQTIKSHCSTLSGLSHLPKLSLERTTTNATATSRVSFSALQLPLQEISINGGESSSAQKPYQRHRRFPSSTITVGNNGFSEAEAIICPDIPVEETNAILRQVNIPNDSINILTLYRYATIKDLIILSVAYLFQIIAGAALPLTNVLVGKITTTFADLISGDVDKAEYTDKVISLTMHFIYIGAGIGVSCYISIYILGNRGEVIAGRTRKAFFQSLLRQNMAYFEYVGQGEIARRLRSDMQQIQEAISDNSGMAVSHTATFVSAIIVGFLSSWNISLTIIALLCSIFVAYMLAMTYIRKLDNSITMELKEGRKVVSQTIDSIHTTTALGTSKFHAQRFYQHLKRASVPTEIQIKLFALLIGFIWFIVYVAYGLAFWKGFKEVDDDNIGAGELLTTISSLIIAGFALSGAYPVVQGLRNGIEAARNIYETIDRPSPIDPLEEGKYIPTITRFNVNNNSNSHNSITKNGVGRIRGLVEFKEVRLRYPVVPSKLVLDNVDLTINANECVAIVGPQGCGKSAILSLLERYYDPVGGQIFVDKVDISEYNVQYLRQQIAIVTQEAVLFQGTIFDNIVQGLKGTKYETLDSKVQEEMVIKVCREVNAWGFILAMDLGLYSLVGERGCNLTISQRQRVSLARVIISRPAILLLDEATSALNPRSSKCVFTSLAKLRRTAHTTIIMVTSSLSTILQADRVVVMGRGRIVDEGSHWELVARNSWYSDFTENQEYSQKRQQRQQKIRHQHHISTANVDYPDSNSNAVIMFNKERQLVGRPVVGQMGNSASFQHELLHWNNCIYEEVDEDDNSAPDIGTIYTTNLGPGLNNRQDYGSNNNNSFGHSRFFGGSSSNSNNSIYNTNNNVYNASHTVGYDFTGKGSKNETLYKSGGGTIKTTTERPKKRVAKPIQLFSMASLFGMLIRINKEAHVELFFGEVAALICGIGYPTVCVFFARCMEALLQPDEDYAASKVTIQSYTIYIVILSAIQFVSNFGLFYLMGRASDKLVRKLRYTIFRHVLRMDIEFFDSDSADSESITLMLLDEANRLRNLAGNVFGMVQDSSVALFVGLFVVIAADWRLGLVASSLIPVLVACCYLRYTVHMNFQKQAKIAYERSAALATDAVAAVRELTAQGREQQFLDLYNWEINTRIHQRHSWSLFTSVLYAASQGAVPLCLCLQVWLGSKLLGEDKIDIYQFYIAFITLLIAGQAIQAIFNFVPEINLAQESIGNIARLLDIIPEMDECSQTGIMINEDPPSYTDFNNDNNNNNNDNDYYNYNYNYNNGVFGNSCCQDYSALLSNNNSYNNYTRNPDYNEDFASPRLSPHNYRTFGVSEDYVKGKFEFRQVAFQYPFQPEYSVLQDVSFRIEPQQLAAIVGPEVNSSDRGAVLELLELFYKPHSGGIYLDGINIEELNLASYRRIIGYVNSKAIFLEGLSIKDNIMLGWKNLENNNILTDENDYYTTKRGGGGSNNNNNNKKGKKSKRSIIGGYFSGINIINNNNNNNGGEGNNYGRPMNGQQEENEQDGALVTACKICQIHDFIMGLPDGYDTVGGVMFRPSQKIRIALARAILRDPNILLIDDVFMSSLGGTSSLSNEDISTELEFDYSSSSSSSLQSSLEEEYHEQENKREEEETINNNNNNNFKKKKSNHPVRHRIYNVGSTRSEVSTILNAIKRASKGRTTILVTSNIKAAKQISDQMIYIERGQVISE